MSASLAELLVTLGDCHRRLGRFKLLDALNPSVDTTVVRTQFAKHGLASRDELETLYAWHNGTGGSEDLTLDDLWLFPGFIFQPLEEMLDIYDQLNSSEYWNPDWFPVFMDDAGDFYVVDYNAQVSGSIRRIRNEYIDQPIIEYRSLEAMVRTLVAAYDANAFFVDSSGDFTYSPAHFDKIAAVLNPDISWWNDQEFA